MSSLALSIAWGLVAALSWGIADYLARAISMGLGSFRAQLWCQMVGAVGLSVAVVARDVSGHGVDVAAVPAGAWVWGIAYAAISGVAVVFFFEAFGAGKVAVVAPIVGGYGAVTVAWCLAFGATWTALTAARLAAIIVGGGRSSIPAVGADDDNADAQAERARHRRGVVAACVAAFLFGTGFFVLGKEVVGHLGAFVPALLSRVVGPLILGVVAIPLRAQLKTPLTPPPRALWALVLASGLLSATATVATGLGADGGDAAVVAVTGSLSVVVTIVIAMVRLRERLAPHQWLGAGIAIAGIVALA